MFEPGAEYGTKGHFRNPKECAVFASHGGAIRSLGSLHEVQLRDMARYGEIWGDMTS